MGSSLFAGIFKALPRHLRALVLEPPLPAAPQLRSSCLPADDLGPGGSAGGRQGTYYRPGRPGFQKFFSGVAPSGKHRIPPWKKTGEPHLGGASMPLCLCPTIPRPSSCHWISMGHQFRLCHFMLSFNNSRLQLVRTQRFLNAILSTHSTYTSVDTPTANNKTIFRGHGFDSLDPQGS